MTTHRAWRQIPIGERIEQQLRAGGATSMRAFQLDIDDGFLTVFTALEPTPPDGAPGWHLSISHRLRVLRPDGTPTPGRHPTWDEIADARYDLLPLDITVAMMLPPPHQYVNLQPTTFHLHQVQWLDPSFVPPIKMPRTLLDGTERNDGEGR